MIILESWTHNFPTLGAAYNAKENFFKIWDETDRQAAEDKYTAWRNDLPLEVADHFEPIVTAMTNWYDPIFAYFDTGLTNAYTEALNGLVKVIDRTGRGYSFDAIRAKTGAPWASRVRAPFRLRSAPIRPLGMFCALKRASPIFTLEERRPVEVLISP